MECTDNKPIPTRESGTGLRVACFSRSSGTWKATMLRIRIAASPRLSPATTSGRAYTIV